MNTEVNIFFYFKFVKISGIHINFLWRNKQMKNVVILFCLIFILFMTSGNKIFAGGKLSDFEKSANTKNQKSEPTRIDSSKSDSKDNWFSDFCSCLVDIFFSPVSSVKKSADVQYDNRHYNEDADKRNKSSFDYSAAAEKTENEYYATKKKIFSTDVFLNFENLESDVKGINAGMSLKFNGLVFSYAQSYLKEKEPADRLRLHYANISYNAASGEKLDAGFGIGMLNINGDTYSTGISFVLPVAYYVNKLFALSFEPKLSFVKGNSVKDFDVAVLMTFHKNAALKTGYRTIIVNSSKLNGFYGGLNFRF